MPVLPPWNHVICISERLMRSFFVVPTVQFYVVLSHAMVAQKLAITEAVCGAERERDELINGLRGTAKRSSRKLAPRMHYVDHLDGSSCDLVTDDRVWRLPSTQSAARASLLAASNARASAITLS